MELFILPQLFRGMIDDRLHMQHSGIKCECPAIGATLQSRAHPAKALRSVCH